MQEFKNIQYSSIPMPLYLMAIGALLPAILLYLLGCSIYGLFIPRPSESELLGWQQGEGNYAPYPSMMRAH